MKQNITASFKRIGVRLPLIFVIVGFVAPTIGIGYLYILSSTLINQMNAEMLPDQQMLLSGASAIMVVLIAVNAGVLGLFISRSFTRPLREICQATKELEQGNFNVRVNRTGEDELATLAESFNRSAQALAAMDEERRRLDHAKSEFLSITSHELRTPITPLKAQMQMLRSEAFGPLTDAQKTSIDVVLRNAERLEHIIEDFLEISRIEAARLKFNFRPVNLTELITETVSLMQGFAQEKRIRIVAETACLPVIEMDPDRVSQVLRNLLHNAVKFSQEDSTIDVSAEVNKEQVQINVRDHGVGLSAEDQIRVFEPFYQVERTTNRKHGGTGLGLTICRGIIESQKGKIWVDSKIGVGSTFSFTVPLTPVHEIEPIKVLFSPKAEIEKRVLEEFMTVLGPMGSVEFTELKGKNALHKDDLLTYIESLEDSFILRHDHADGFREHIKDIFGEDARQTTSPPR
jgi:signal transduction histidine kinase